MIKKDWVMPDFDMVKCPTCSFSQAHVKGQLYECWHCKQKELGLFLMDHVSLIKTEKDV